MRFMPPSVVSRHTLYAANPIAHAEAAHLERHAAAHPRRGWVIAGLFLAAGAAFAVNAALLLRDTGLDALFRQTTSLWPVLALLAVTFILHMMALFRLSMMTGESVVREKRSSTFETLVMTGIPARRFVDGKLLGVLRVVWREWALLAVVRALLCLGLGATILGSGPMSFTSVSPDMVRYPALQTALAVALIVTFTGVNLLFTGVVGVAASLIARPTSPGGTTATALRLGALVVALIVITGGTLAYLHFGPGLMPPLSPAQQNLVIVLGYASLSLVDNGTIVTGLMASPYSHFGAMDLLMCLLALAVYLLLTAFFYGAAVFLARQQGMG